MYHVIKRCEKHFINVVPTVWSIDSPAVYRATHCGAVFFPIVEKFSRCYRESLGCCQFTERVHGISVVSGRVYSFGKCCIVLCFVQQHCQAVIHCITPLLLFYHYCSILSRGVFSFSLHQTAFWASPTPFFQSIKCSFWRFWAASQFPAGSSLRRRIPCRPIFHCVCKTSCARGRDGATLTDGERLNVFRLRVGLTIRQAAEMSVIRQHTLMNYESEKSKAMPVVYEMQVRLYSIC